MLIKTNINQEILVLTFNHEKPQNPFCIEMQMELIEILKKATTDDTIKAVVLYGGENRSFSAGGDFKQVIELADAKFIGDYLSKIVDFYIELLKFNKPLIAAVDNYAIGIGFQVALTTDYRIGTCNTIFLMPELKNGIACTLGGLMLEHILGRFIMQQICYDCEKLTIEQCLQWKLLNEITEPNNILEKAIEKAIYYGNFPDKAFRTTKKVNNNRFIEALEKVRQQSSEAHIEVILSNQHKKHMENILGISKNI